LFGVLVPRRKIILLQVIREAVQGASSEKLPNLNYIKGRSKEYRVMELLREDGWVVARTAGSHSPVDVFAAKLGATLLVQVKNGKARMKAEEAKELVKWAEAFNADAEIWHFKGRGHLEKRRLRARK
jgi:Holliday junction resolvase